MDFYRDLVPFKSFTDISNPRNYQPIPNSAVVILADIRGSTKAIKEGRYREINTIGASCIASVRNNLDRRDLAYVFGGDGASFVVDEADRVIVVRALLEVQAMAKQNFNLELRVGVVPISTIRNQGRDILLGKYELVPGQFLAVFCGGGLSLADALVKSDSQYLVRASGPVGEPNLQGLSCRWEPLRSRHGHMLSLIIQTQGSIGQGDLNLYQDILIQIQKILGTSLGSLNPVQITNMRLRWIPHSGSIEAGLTSTKGTYLLKRAKVFLSSAFVKFLVTTNIPMGTFRGDRYMQETSSHADYKKFDDMLRMVLDCSKENGDRVIALLEELRSANKIYYGFQKSEEALMTCLVFSSVDDHVHFVDGANGGYALAALAMKEQKHFEKR